MSGIERLECVYYSAPIPRNSVILTILSLLFDRIHFPGVYLPKGDYDKEALKAEIKRLEELPTVPGYPHNTGLLIAILKFLDCRLALDGICEFPQPKEGYWKRPKEEQDAEQRLMERMYDTLWPPRENFIPHFDTNYVKGLPNSDESVQYPGVYQYHAQALIYSDRHQLPLVNDHPRLPFMQPENYKHNAQPLATFLALSNLCVGFSKALRRKHFLVL